MNGDLSREDAANLLREQAASCRHLSRRARTDAGATALTVVADQFETDARRIAPVEHRLVTLETSTGQGQSAQAAGDRAAENRLQFALRAQDELHMIHGWNDGRCRLSRG